MTDFDELKRLATDSQMTVGEAALVAPPPMIEPAVFFKACASLVEAADRFQMMYGYEEVALCELLPRLRDESLPTIWRCFDPHTVKGELLILRGDSFWIRRDIFDLRAMIEKTTMLGATPSGQPLKICGVFTCRRRLDAICPRPTTREDQGTLEYAMVRSALRKALPSAKDNYDNPWVGDKALAKKAREGWEAECTVRERMDLLSYLDGEGARHKVRRAIGR